jgi:hypothetical protein
MLFFSLNGHVVELACNNRFKDKCSYHSNKEAEILLKVPLNTITPLPPHTRQKDKITNILIY